MSNFGNIKDTFKNLVIESTIKKDIKGKKLFSKFLKTIKENETLKNQYLIYSNLQNTKFDDKTEAIDFVKENISLLKGLNEEHINKGNEFFLKILKGNEIVKENQEFYNKITYLVNTKKTPSNIKKINETINFIVNPMLEKEVTTEEVVTESVDLPPSVLTKLAVNKFNSRYSNISESEKEIIKTVLNGSNEDKEEIFNKLKRECIDAIDNKLNESSDLDLR
jgi:predicted transcriptional regulator